MFYVAGKTAAVHHYLGALVGGIGGVALQMLLDKDLRAELLQAPNPKVHPQTIAAAAEIAPLLKHLDPQTARIGIGGRPGTGKTELARELALRLGMQHHDADWGFGTRAVPPGHITDGFDTLVNQDPAQFDALLHLKRPDAPSERATERLIDVAGIERATQQQFDAARGELLRPTATARLRLRPPGGFGISAKNQGVFHKGEAVKLLAPGAAGALAGAIAAALLRK